jgi:chemotaxis signal transduction protein
MTDMSAPLPTGSSPDTKRFILGKLEQLILVFPSALVAEILLIERSQILSLPFYNPTILGCIHQGGQIVPLIASHQLFGIQITLREEVLTVVRLGESAKNLAGVGLIVDRIMGSQTEEQLPPEVFGISQGEDSNNLSSTLRLFEPRLISSDLFRPQRWQPDLVVQG